MPRAEQKSMILGNTEDFICSSLNRINPYVFHAIIRVRIINKRNNFDRVDLVSNHERKIGTPYRKTWVAD